MGNPDVKRVAIRRKQRQRCRAGRKSCLISDCPQVINKDGPRIIPKVTGQINLDG